MRKQLSTAWRAGGTPSPLAVCHKLVTPHHHHWRCATSWLLHTVTIGGVPPTGYPTPSPLAVWGNHPTRFMSSLASVVTKVSPLGNTPGGSAKLCSAGSTTSEPWMAQHGAGMPMSFAKSVPQSYIPVPNMQMQV